MNEEGSQGNERNDCSSQGKGPESAQSRVNNNGREGKGQDSWYMEIESPALHSGLHVGEEREEHSKGDWCIFLFPQNIGYRRRDRRVLGTMMNLSGGSV